MGSVNVRQRVSSSFAALLAVVPSRAFLSTKGTSTRALATVALSLLVVGCGGSDAADSELSPGAGFPEDPAFPDTFAECGASLNVLLDAEDDAAPRLDASYSEALAGWSFPNEYCGLGVFSGVCADGKRVLYRNGGFTSEIRYYDGEQLVGYVGSGDVGFCPSVCPFSRFFGTPESVRCEAPSFEALCERVPAPADGAAVWMPFANGQVPGGCDL